MSTLFVAVGVWRSFPKNYSHNCSGLWFWPWRDDVFWPILANTSSTKIHYWTSYGSPMERPQESLPGYNPWDKYPVSAKGKVLRRWRVDRNRASRNTPLVYSIEYRESYLLYEEQISLLRTSRPLSENNWMILEGVSLTYVWFRISVWVASSL